jgi:transposase, IS5 family
LRCGLLKQHRQLSYEELAFHLEDSASFRAFARLPLSWTPKKAVLHMTISAIRAETWEAINRILLVSARQEKVETGKVVRLDSTVTAALMHEPSDSSLLWDAVRVMVRLLKRADALVGGHLVWRNHRRAAKKRARAIEYARNRPNRVPLYRELIKLTRATLAYADQAATQLWQASDPIAAALWQAEFRHYHPLIGRIVAQTERRVLHGQAIAANEKIVSLFEPHADIIVKGGREVQYGHKLNLTTGHTGLILDLVIEAGNPADSERFLPMLNATSASMARRRDRPPPTAVSPAVIISPMRRPSASATWRSTRRPACASSTWSRATGSIASCATSEPASNRTSRV